MLKSVAARVTLLAAVIAALSLLLRNAREFADTLRSVSSPTPAVAEAVVPEPARSEPVQAEPSRAMPARPEPARRAPANMPAVGTQVSTPDYGSLFVGGSCVSELPSRRGGFKTLHEIWNCVLPRGASMARIRCDGGQVVAEYCARGCTTNPNGSDDYCR